MQQGFDWSKSQFSLKMNELNYKNFYYLNNVNNNKKVLYNYSFRIFAFFKLNEYLKINNFKKKNFLNILFLNYSLLWNFFLQTKNPQLYYYLIKLVSTKYKNLFFSTNLDIFFQNNSGSFSNFLNFFNINFNSKKKVTLNNLKTINFFIEKNIKNLNKINQGFLENNIIFFQKNFGNSKFVINFLRVQRRYNKRRYSKVRATSRPSFFGGISLSSVFLGLLWGGSIKGVDWLTSWIVVIDINFFLFSIFFYFIFRLWRLFYLNTFTRKKNKIKIINSLHNMFIFKIFLKN